MSELLIENGTVITLNNDQLIYEKGAVVIRDGKVAYVGIEPAVSDDAQMLDARGGLILPGFINAHTHIYSAFALGLSPKMPPAANFNDVLERLWFPLDKALSLEDIRYSALAVYTSCIRMGTTAIIDHHESQGCQDGVLDVIETAAREAGIRSVLCCGASDRYGKGHEGVAEGVRFIKKLGKSDGKIAGMMGLHALFTVEDETLHATCEEAARQLWHSCACGGSGVRSGV